MRTIGDAFGAILILARHIHIAPFRAGGDDDTARFQYCAGRRFNLMQAAFCCGRNQFTCALAVDNVNVVIADMRFQRARQFLAFGFRHRDIVFDIHGIQHLTAEALAHQTGTDAFARRVDRRRRARRAGADNQHVIRIAFVQRFRRAFFCASIHFSDNLGQSHTSLAELFTVNKYRRNTHHVTFGDFVLEGAAINCRMFNTRVQHRHQVQRLHYVRAVMTGE